MTPRTYALAVIGIGAGLFLAVIATNLIIDPTSVFGTSLLPAHHTNRNERYLRFADYQRAPERFDGLLFGSSRAGAIGLDELSRQTGGARFAHFGVNGGTLTDHFLVLDYLLRKSPSARLIRVVFVLFDADALGVPPATDLGPMTYLPPSLTGENPIRFWWKNLTAVQIRTWYDALLEAFGGVRPTRIGPLAAAGPAGTIFAGRVSPAALAEPLEQRPGAGAQLERITLRAQYHAELALWQRFVALCRAHAVSLIAVAGPLRRDNRDRFDQADLADALNAFGRIWPIWDFTGSDRVASEAKFWHDQSHYSDEVGTMMLRRIFGEAVPAEWKDFGRLRGP